MNTDILYALELKVLPQMPHAPAIKYRDLLVLLLRTPRPGKGIVKQELKLRMQLIRLVEAAEEECIFGQQALDFLRGVAESYPWPIANAHLEQFLDDLDHCPEVPADHPLMQEKEG